MAAAALKEHSFSEEENCSGFIGLAGRAVLMVSWRPELEGWGLGSGGKDSIGGCGRREAG